MFSLWIDSIVSTGLHEYNLFESCELRLHFAFNVFRLFVKPIMVGNWRPSEANIHVCSRVSSTKCPRSALVLFPLNNADEVDELFDSEFRPQFFTLCTITIPIPRPARIGTDIASKLDVRDCVTDHKHL